ncbi:MAG: hypothetical protein IT514_15870 [Burkholderiales bacterium]|nr:hypothetical protein [Burkholderiales bacterium]
MKVLKKGRAQKGWAAKLKCTGDGNGGGGCGATLLVEEGDLLHTASHAGGDTDHSVSFYCPECGVLTDTKAYHGDIHKLKKGRGMG